MTPERKAYLSARRKQHKLDRLHAEAVKTLGITDYPMDLPSLDMALDGSKRIPWLTTGFDWIDKPHRVAYSAMDEIRALRTYILNNLNKP